MKEKLLKTETLKNIVISFIVAVILQFIYIFYNNVNLTKREYLNLFSVKKFVFLFVLILALSFVYSVYKETINKFVYNKRYFLAGVIVVFCVALQLSGSSVNIWSDFLPSSHFNGLVCGTPRLIRSDEYAVNTPFALSQCFGPSGPFGYFGSVLRAAKTDMFIVYGQPVLNWAEIFRPFHWGYIILGAGYGLSFFWTVRLVSLILVSFEFGMLAFNNKKTISCIYSVLISFSSVVAWWFAANGLIEMLVFGQLIVLIVNGYMKTKSYKTRILLALAFVWAGEGYILTFYPAWQIPLFYVFLIFVVWVIVKNRGYMRFSLKKDLFVIISAVLLLSVCSFVIFSQSKDAILSTVNTVYPGARQETGGGCLRYLFFYASNLFTPIKDKNILLNQSELGMFFSFFPLGIILSLFVIIKEKNRDLLLILLLGLTLFFGVYISFGLPLILCKITLLSQAPAFRVLQTAFGLINVILLLRSLTLLKQRFKVRYIFLASVVFGLFVGLMTYITMKPYVTKFLAVIIFVVVGVGVFLMLYKKGYKLALLFCVLLSLQCGFIVNPIQRGVSEITQNPLYLDIQNIVNEYKTDTRFLVEGDSFVLNNFPITAGAPTINCTNTYPNLELYEKLDKDSKYEQCYNRYADILISLKDGGETTFANPGPDQCRIELSSNDLYILHPNFILSKNDLTVFSNDKQSIFLYNNVGDCKIFKVEYK